jgi:hypothetical protein
MVSLHGTATRIGRSRRAQTTMTASRGSGATVRTHEALTIVETRGHGKKGGGGMSGKRVTKSETASEIG